MTKHEQIDALQNAFRQYVVPSAHVENCRLDYETAEQLANTVPVELCIKVMRDSYALWLQKKKNQGVSLSARATCNGLRTAITKYYADKKRQYGSDENIVNSFKLSRQHSVKPTTPKAEDEILTLRTKFQSHTDGSWTLRDEEVKEFIARSNAKILAKAIDSLEREYPTSDYELALSDLTERIDALVWKLEAAALTTA